MKLHWCDVETTGLSKDINEIVQLSGIIEHDGVIIEEYDVFMKPNRLNNVEEGALKAQGRTIEELMEFPDRRLGYDEFKTLLENYKDEKYTWTGQNPEFDRGFVRVFMIEFGDKSFDNYFKPVAIDLISTAKEAKRKGHYKGENFKLPTICKTLGIDYQAHDSLEDIRATRIAMRKFDEIFRTPTHVRAQLSFLPENPIDD